MSAHRSLRSQPPAAIEYMHTRVVKPEILDHLLADDPESLRSRRDLRRINLLMGNERWICGAISRYRQAAAAGIVEFGAGDAVLAGKIARMFPDAPVTAYDLAPRPKGLEPRVGWVQGDLLGASPPPIGGVLVANFFLHHFEGAGLRALGKICENFEVLVVNEPDRAVLPHLLGVMMWPLINRVTRHDMHVSIRAGFAAGEIPDMLGLDRGAWRIHEHFTWRGARRVLCSRAG